VDNFVQVAISKLSAQSAPTWRNGEKGIKTNNKANCLEFRDRPYGQHPMPPKL